MTNVTTTLSVPSPPAFLELIHSNHYVLVSLEEIILLRAEINYVRIFIRTGKVYIHAKTLKSYDTFLQKTGFIRTHKSYLVNMKYLVDYKMTDEGDCVQLLDGKIVPVSKRRRLAVRMAIEQQQSLMKILD